ncbi:MAG: hypothetical protein WC451_06395, partial [Patescibacteria group bacterium]
MISKIREDAVIVPKTFGYKITKGLLTLSDEEEACTKFKWAYEFALKIPGADIETYQEAACKDSYWAYRFAWGIPAADIEK